MILQLKGATYDFSIVLIIIVSFINIQIDSYAMIIHIETISRYLKIISAIRANIRDTSEEGII